MAIATLNATVAPAPSPAAPTPAPAAAAAREPGAFARELDRAAQSGDTGGESEDAAEAAEAANPASAAPAPAGSSASARAKARAAADGKSAERKPEHAAVRDEDRVTALGTESSLDKTTGDTGTAATDLQALLASLMAHAPAPPSPAARGGDAHGAASDTAAAAAGGEAPVSAQGGGQAATLAAPALPQPADAAAAALPAFTLAQAATSAPAAPTEAAPPAPVHQAQVSAAVGTPEFAPGLSAEVNVMLRDGLQEARLQLNPAEMGPITVQIQIDGNNAQINLSAEQAPTRDALEQALPTLAGTLRDSGLTLTGGGVFEQPRPPRDDNAPQSGQNGRGGGDGGSAAVTAATGNARTLAPRGVVDLYA